MPKAIFDLQAGIWMCEVYLDFLSHNYMMQLTQSLTNS